MKINLILSKKNENKDIKMFTFDVEQEKQILGLSDKADSKFYEWLKEINLNESVLVCFESFKDTENYRDKINSFLVSHCWDDITDYFDLHTDTENDVYFSAFEFDNYSDAFDFCLLYREGF